MDRLLFIASNALVLSAAWSMSRIALPHASIVERVLGVLAGVPIVVLPVMLALGATGTLRIVPAIVVVGLLAAVLGVWAFRRGRPSVTSEAEPSRALDAALAGALAGIIAWQLHPLVVRHALRSMNLHWDDLSYHAPMPGHWLQAERLVLAPFNYHAYYAANAELFVTWFMLPTRLDAFAALATLHWLLLAAAVVATLCARLGASAAGVGFGIAALLACKPFAHQASSFAAVDLAGTALGGAAFAIALGATRTPSPRGDDLFGRTFYVACLAGLAIGAKISFAPIGFLAVVCILPSLARDRRSLGIGLALGATCMLACGGYWYLRNFTLTGNPLFPAEIAFFEGPLDRAAQRQTTLLFQLREKLDAAGRIKAWKELFDWPRAVAYVWLAGYAAAALALVLPASWREPTSRRAALVLVGGLLVTALVCITPFSGTVNARWATIDVRLRFLLPVALLGVPLAAWALERVRMLRPVLLVVAGAYLVHAARLPVGPVAAAAATGAVVWIGARALSRTFLARALPIAASLACLALPVAAERAMLVKQPKQDAALRKIIPAWEAVDTLPEGARVAWFSTFDSYKYYPVFGRGLVHVPVAVEPDGSRYRFLHEDWREVRPTWWKSRGRKRAMQKLVANLQRQRVDYVFVMKRHAGPWPKQFDLLLKEPTRAKLVLRRRSAALFEIPPA